MHGTGATETSEVDFPKWICQNQSQAKKEWLRKHAGTVECLKIWGEGLSILLFSILDGSELRDTSKVIIDKSRSEVSLSEQDTIENVS